MSRRVAVAIVLSLAVAWLVGGSTLARQPGQQAGGHACAGLANAYSHAADPALDSLRAVAAKLGCDLSGVVRVAKPGGGPDSASQDEDAPEPSQEADEPDEGTQELNEAGPDVQGKCDRIAQKLAAAQARPHGKSAAAFARQATRWSCTST